jgi:hypothetical protein
MNRFLVKNRQDPNFYNLLSTSKMLRAFIGRTSPGKTRLQGCKFMAG